MNLFKKQHKQVRQPRISDKNDAYAFRRSRTMTGTSSDEIRVVAETHTDLKSDRLKHYVLRKKRQRILVYLSSVIAVVFGLIALLNNFMSSVIVVSAGKAPETQIALYERAVNEYLSQYPSERFIFALRGDALLMSLQKELPEIRAVTFDVRSWLKPARVTIDLRKPIASWTIGASKYYIDSYGVAFKNNYYGVEPLLSVEDKTGIDPTSTVSVASERMIHYIGRVVALLEQRDLSVVRLELPSATSRRVDIYVADRPYAIRTSIDRDPAGQVVDIVNAIKYLNVKNITPSYADVRVSSKLYYK